MQAQVTFSISLVAFRLPPTSLDPCHESIELSGDLFRVPSHEEGVRCCGWPTEGVPGVVGAGGRE